MAATRPTSEPEYEYDEHTDAGEGEVISGVDAASSLAIASGEINQQIATAKRFPRSIKQFIDTAIELATLDEETAGECIYALPRDGKTIEGPSARFAEILTYAWGNCRAGARSIGEDATFVKSQGTFYDLEKNVGIQFEVSRRIVDKNGKRYKPDMVGTTANAAGSIALRNAVLKGIPKAFWNRVYQCARKVVAGDFKTLGNRRAEVAKQFSVYGVTPEMIFALLQIRGAEDITLDHMVVLKGVLTAIKEGETTVEQIFSPGATQDVGLADKAANVANGIKERYARKPQTSEGQSAANSDPQQPASTEAPAVPAEILTLSKEQAQAKLEELRKQVKAIENQTPIESSPVSEKPSEPQVTPPAEVLGEPGIFAEPESERGRRRR
jgi:hypothetical protein